MADDFFSEIETIDAADLFGDSDEAVIIPDDPDPVFLPSRTLTRPNELSAIGLATQYFEKYNRTVRYVTEQKGFYNYIGGVWTIKGNDEQIKAQQIANDLFDQMMAAKANADRLESLRAEGQAKLDEVNQACKTAELLTSFYYTKVAPAPDTMYNRILRQVAPHVTIDPNEFDPNPALFNMANGSFELEAGKFREHRASDLCSMQSPVRYDAAAKCPYILARLNEIFRGDEEIIAFFQRMCGYALSGFTSEQKFPIFYAGGANGKGALFRLLGKLMGAYATSLSIDALSDDKQNGGHNEPIANTRGKRLLFVSETEKRKRLATGLIKLLTGEDEVTASRKGEHEIRFFPKFKVFLAANDKPDIQDTSDGMWRRVMLVPMLAKFLDSGATLRPGWFYKDDKAEDTMATELPGFFNWCAEGFKEWRKQGLNPPRSIIVASNEYREDSDRVGGFIADCLMSYEQLVEAEKERVAHAEANNYYYNAKEIDPEKISVVVGSVYECYEKWCIGHGMKPQNMSNLREELLRKGFTKEKVGGQIRWLGYVLRAEE